MKTCAKCNVKRELMVSAKVTEQPAGITMAFKTMCMLCFLKQFNFYDPYEYKVDYKLLMAHVEKVV